MVDPAGRRTRIAVAGATGRVGSTLTGLLASDPVNVVALTRRPDAVQLPSGVATAAINFDQPETLSEALRGTERLFLAHGTSARQVANEIAVIDAAIAAGVSHIVKLSAMGPPTRLHPFDWHMAIEAHLAACDIGYTVLRPGSFVNILARAATPVATNTWGGAAGDGRVNLIDVHDVAAAARVALLDGSFLRAQRAYHLTGPAAVSMPEVADELSRLLGRSVTYQHRTPAEHRDVLIASGLDNMVAGLLLGLDQLFREGVLAETTNTVSDLTGKEARPVAGWLRDNISAFLMASTS
ncbi:NAD(P)H-binding protein [Pararoseomonas indoligenes]|uniref:NAD(P)H-binding protein n=1 Tax=Roseomonas indoligenes TaxID=2820811 RepID=A0A940S648_9PROT|nr:NAD(P)H-binding protein [Pararoseomonas indoligenes]MBP0495131.1 NAD(P)H-binding protein [Pararoseomonas indoligenes]